MFYIILTGSYSDRGVLCLVSYDGYNSVIKERLEQASVIADNADEANYNRWNKHRKEWFCERSLSDSYRDYDSFDTYLIYEHAYRGEFPDSNRSPKYFDRELERLGCALIEYEEIDLD